MAMGLFMAKIKDHEVEWKVASAGLFALPGYPPALNTKLVLRQRGIELSQHRSVQITPEMIQEFNLILTMEQGQKEALQAAFPDQAQKIFLLSEMIDQNWDIADPIGLPMADFEATAVEIEAILSEGFQRIVELAGDSEG